MTAPATPQTHGLRPLTLGTLATALLPIGGALLAENSILPITIAVVIFAGIALISLKMPPEAAKILVSVALIGEIGVLTASLAGHPWQVDSHMAFFAALACMMVLNDLRPIIVTTALIVVHHLSLSIVFPALIYPPEDMMHNLERVIVHGVAAAVESVALLYAVAARQRINTALRAEGTRLAAAQNETETSLQQAKVALREAERAKSEAEEAQRSAQASARHAEEEAERARVADAQAAEARDREAARKAAIEAEQKQVVETLGEALGALSQKKLETRIAARFPSEYENLRLDFNAAAEALDGAMSVVRDATRFISDQANGIATATSDLAQKTETQAATLAEVSSTVSSISGQVEETAQTAKSANSDAQLTSRDASTSAQLVSDAVQAMGLIEESSSKITSIIGTIDEISFQTNLLALNAGVEAARAGESGRGFAVVASEVRALAQRSSDAALEIKNLIETSSKMVKDGVSLVNRTGDSLSSVTKRVDDIAKLVARISDSAAQQSVSLKEIDNALGGLDRVTQQNAAMFEETTAANQEMKTHTDQLFDAIADFSSTAATASKQHVA